MINCYKVAKDIISNEKRNKIKKLEQERLLRYKKPMPIFPNEYKGE